MNSSELRKSLEKIIASHPYNPVTFDGNAVCHLNRWLVTSSLGNKNRFDLSAVYNSNAKVLSSKEIENLNEDEIEKNWRFYLSEDSSSFYKRNSPEKLFNRVYDRTQEKYVYCLSSIYCEKGIELLVHVSNTLPMPMKLWINGEIVFIGTLDNFSKNHILSFCFEEGINTILVEKPMCSGNRRLALTPKWFSVSIRPVELIVNSAVSKVIKQDEILNTHLSSYTISTNKLFYDVDEKIQILILRNKSHDERDICIELTCSNNDTICQRTIRTGIIDYISIKPNAFGVVKISVKNRNDYCYIFVGDFREYGLNLETKINQTMLSESDKHSFMLNLKILDKEKGFILNSIEPIHKNYSQPVLDKLFLFEKQYRNNDFNDSIYNGFNAYISPIDGENLTYFLQIPTETECLYPLIIYFNFDDSSTRIPTSPNRVLVEKPNNAITITFCGRGDYMNDYVNEFEIMSAIDYVINRFPVDNNRIHLYGICTGARRGFNFLNKYKNVFASIFSFAGTPTEIEDLNPKSPIPVYQLCNIDDVIYNGATVLKNAINYKSKIYCVSGFEHEEFIDYFCNKNTLNLFLSHSQILKPKIRKTTISEMSIKSIYLNRCTVIINNSSQDRDFASLLTQPLKCRARNYKYMSACSDTSIEFSQTNFIIVSTLENLSGYLPNHIYELIASRMTDFQLYDSDDYFIISLEENPFDRQKKILFIIYYGVGAEKELRSLWGRFDCEPLFNKRQIIFSLGNYLDVEEHLNENY